MRVTIFTLLGVIGAAAAPAGFLSFHFHLQQPIYWPAKSVENPLTYQKAYESVQLQGQQGGHPRNDIDSIFSKADRVADYQHYASDAINACSSSPDMGAQVSFSGCLIENLNSLAAHNSDGYSPGWNSTYAKAAETLKTSGGFPKLDFVGFTYHHSLLTLTMPPVLRKSIEIHKVIHQKTWGVSGYSKGLFPAEMAFTTRSIPTLVDMGFEWVIVSNSHISRACKDYPYSVSGDNNDPPNPADQVNPAQSDYFNLSISRGCTPNNANPFAYRPHRAQHVDPTTGNVSSIVVVPAAQALSWIDSSECSPISNIQEIVAKSDPAQPSLILLAHDGDNAFSGGYTYYTSCVPTLVDQAASSNIQATTIEQYLHDFPVAEDDIVHVEDGAWVNADGDFGAPQSLNWNWPLQANNSGTGEFDIPAGWSVKQRNYAIIIAAQNLCETAEQMAGGVRIAEVQAPTSDATNAELAWHNFIPATTSGFEYYGNAMDLEEKPTVACNNAVVYAKAAITAALTSKQTSDTTPPTVWTLQRLAWNPGGIGAGSLWGYKATPMNSSFYIYTFVGDASGVKSATLMWRQDADGVNPLSTHDNELYEPHSTAVGDWQPLDMTLRAFPAGNPYDVSVDFTCDATDKPCYPTDIADEAFVMLSGVKGLIDYYVEAVDSQGNVAKSDIYHVFIK